MTVEWQKIIGIAHLVRTRVAEVDDGLWPYFLPQISATEKELLDYESSTREPIPSEYRAFLSFANGWKAFHQNIDLFGLNELREIRPSSRVNQIIQTLEPLEKLCSLRSSEVFPIALSESSSDVFLIGKESSDRPGCVFWIAGQLVEQFSSFREFFLAMMDYNRDDVREFESNRQL